MRVPPRARRVGILTGRSIDEVSRELDRALRVDESGAFGQGVVGAGGFRRGLQDRLDGIRRK